MQSCFVVEEEEIGLVQAGYKYGGYGGNVECTGGFRLLEGNRIVASGVLLANFLN